MQNTTYIGFSSTQHDPAVAVINEHGKLVYAQANERVLKNKRAWNVVPDAISVLQELTPFLSNTNIKAGLSWSDNGLRWSSIILYLSYLQKKYCTRWVHKDKKAGYIYMNEGLRQSMYKAPNSNKNMLLNLEYRLSENPHSIAFTKSGHDHHLCHAANACYTSLFRDGICLILDGMGEGASYSIFRFSNDNITPLIKSLS